MRSLGSRQPRINNNNNINNNADGDDGTWHLHAKDVPRIDLAAVAELQGGEESRQQFEFATGWLHDDARYNSVPEKGARGAPTTGMPDAWIDELQQRGIITPIARKQIRGWVRMFVVPEPAKKRWRPIKHTLDANTALGRDTVMHLRFPTKQDIAALVHEGECFIALDFSAYFDQFVYTPEVASRFCFRKSGKYYRLGTLAMGERHAVEVAHCTTLRLLDFGPRSKTAAVIDNVVFAGSRDDVVRDATIFVERVRAVGAKLNEDTSDITTLVQSSGVWCGVALDMTRKTSALAPKTVDKIETSWRLRNTWTWRTFAGHIGLLFWAWNIIDVPVAEFFPLLRFIGEVGRLLTEHEDWWDHPAKIWTSAWPSLERWSMLALRNQPRAVPQQQTPEWLVATDASAWGWGYFAVHTTTGETRTHGERWKPFFAQRFGHRLGVSTFTEPQGVVNAMCHLIDPTHPTRVRVLTDNTPTQAAFSRGFSSQSYNLNECAARLRRLFDNDDFVFDFGYLPGWLNPADTASRGGPIANGEKTRDSMSAAELQRLAGSAVPPGQSDWPPRVPPC